MRNKIMAVLFASVLSVTTLAGCGSQPTAPAAGSDTGAAQSAQTDTAKADATTADAPAASAGKFPPG